MENEIKEKEILHQFEEEKGVWKAVAVPAAAIFLIVVAGAVSGFFLSRRGPTASGLENKELMGGAQMVDTSEGMGIKDEKVFRDTAKGKIEVNDFSVVKDGSHKLLRPGGQSQTAYLTSSVVDLNQFKNECVQIWGETFAGQSAGWLMDVGRVKILDDCPEGL